MTRKGGDKLVVHTLSENDETVADLRRQTIRVESISEKERLRQPPPPFITSSLQQTASSVLGFSPKRTMKLAQELYEGVVLDEGGVGLITYMRTDSVRVSDAAVDSARRLIEDRFGRDYLSQGVRHYRNQKRSQDAHEAIRPTDLAHSPDAIASHLTTDQQKLYGLVYNRFLSTQMAPAAYRQRKALLSAGPYTLEAAGSTLTSAGFLVLFPEEKAEKDEVPAWLREEEVVVLEDVLSIRSSPSRLGATAKQGWSTSSRSRESAGRARTRPSSESFRNADTRSRMGGASGPRCSGRWSSTSFGGTSRRR